MIIAINGSPRIGNTDKVLNKVLEQIKADWELVRLNELKIKPHNGEKKCDYSDDLDGVVNKMREAQVIILASPSYFNNVTGIMKNFIDRCNQCSRGETLKGTKVALITIGEDKAVHIKGCLKAMRDFASAVHMDVYEELLIEDNNTESPEAVKLGEAINAGI